MGWIRRLRQSDDPAAKEPADRASLGRAHQLGQRPSETETIDLYAAIFIFDAWGEEADLRLGLCSLKYGLQKARAQQGVRIQHQVVFGRQMAHTLIVSSRKSSIIR